MDNLPEFVDFYRAVNGRRDPFPWQRRLAQLVEKEKWPDEIGIPTGLGKTSCIDIAIWALAKQAGMAPGDRMAATRTWYVVNRRLLVDVAYSHGCRIAGCLSKPSQLLSEDMDEEDVEIVSKVASALKSIGGGASAMPLQVARLRGGAELGARPLHPAQPALIFATVPMFASRWMFRGFGSSQSMSSVDAALAGTDSLVLLDEAHLARPLLKLEGPLGQCDIGDPTSVVPGRRARPVLVSLTATGEANLPFTLDEDDFAHTVVQRRLDAAKPIGLVSTKSKSPVADMCKQTKILLAKRPPSTAVVFANTPAVARQVFRELTKSPSGFQLELLTGRVRDREGDRIRTRLLDPVAGAPAGQRSGVRDKHLIVVATQTLEVGADLDFDVLVTEACGTRALTQRLGRLNRLGMVPDAAGALVFAESEKQFGIYGEEPKLVWKVLQGASENCVVNLEPRVVRRVLGSPSDAAQPAGELLPAHLWEWAKTTTPPQGEAPPELFFNGFEQDYARVSIAWRTAIPENGEALIPPLTEAEVVEVPLWEARSDLGGLAPFVARLGPDKATIESPVATSDLRPGDQVLVPTSLGGYDEFGWEPSSRVPILDLSLLRPPGVPLVSDALCSLLAEGDDRAQALELARLLSEGPAIDDELDRSHLTSEFLAHFVAAGKSSLLDDEEWEQLVASIRPEIGYPLEGVPRLTTEKRSRVAQAQLRSEALDELNFSASSPRVSDHLGSVGELAGRIAQAVGMTGDLVETIALAGRVHDLGKFDLRFQRWLDPRFESPVPVAKSNRPWHQWERDRIASGWPKGGRHEELSRRLVAAWLPMSNVKVDEDLLLHLVASHHGQGRPLVRTVHDPLSAEVSALVEGLMVTVSADLGQADWDQPARFHRCCESYGLWGLALMEAVLRQADHHVSQVVVV